ncbi:MAG: DegT/DnrJ/EryC1/StrS family aminotransferase [Bacteroidetes bacterium]|nr:DegT/DnrJ/EryC1/StrS family aminotransferase [Bacteroidota bacterium]
MPSLQMVDLIGQHAKIRTELDEAIKGVIDNASFIKGEDVKLFESELSQYLGVKNVIGCANGTDALQAALMALNLPSDSEILVPDFTFIATAEVIALLGLTPVFIDVDKETFNISIEGIKKAITPKTKCIFPVHMFGQPCDMESIMNIAREHNLYVIEDTAQGLGSDVKFSDGSVKKCGTIGDIGTTSFFPSKNLSCMGDGGAIFTNNDELALKIAKICNHGMGKQYTYEAVGMNSRLDTIQAAVLRVKLRHLDEYNAARNQVASSYSGALNSISQLSIPETSAFANHIFHQYTLIVKDNSRDDLQNYLIEHNIPTKVYYPIPFHAHAPYNNYPHNLADLQNSIWLSDHVLSLPMHTELSEDDIKFITNHIINFYRN